MGARIKDITGEQLTFEPELVLLVDRIDTGSGDWLQGRKLTLNLLGNTYFQGSVNNVNWHDEIDASDAYIQFTTDGGTHWRELSTKNVREDVNLYFTEARVIGISQVADAITATHIHSNFSLLENLIDSGSGTDVLTDNGTYQSATVIFGTIGSPDVQAIDFDTTPSTDPLTIGRLQWSPTEFTLELGVEGGTIDINKELFDIYYDDSSGSLIEGDVVSVVSINGNRQAVDLTDSTSVNSSTACIGMVTNVNADNTVRVTKKGRVRGLNTLRLTEGMPVYVDSANPGKLTQTPPTAPDYFVHVGIVEVAHLNQGIIDVDIRVSPRVKDLSDVNGTALTTTGQLMVWDNANSRFDFTEVYGKFGDVAGGNYAGFEADGTLVFYGNATYWRDIDFPILIRTTGVNIPTLAAINGNLTLPQWAVNDFNMCESQEFVHEWKEGSTVYWHIHLTTNGLNVDNRYVRFEVEYGYGTVGGEWIFPATLDSGELLIPANTPTKTQLILSLGNFTPTGVEIGGHVVARLKRVAASGTAPTNNPWVPMLQLHVECDSVGSREMAGK